MNPNTRHIFPRYMLMVFLAFGCAAYAVAEETTYYQLTPQGQVSDGRGLSGWIKALSDPDASERLAAVRAIKGIYPDQAARAVPALTALLNDRSETVRQAAAEALGGFGSQARPAIPGLVRCLSDPIEPVRNAAAAALFDIGANRDRAMDPEPEKALQQALQKAIVQGGESIRTQLMMVDALGMFACIDSYRFRPCLNLTAPAVHELSIKVLAEIAGDQQSHPLLRERACGALAGFHKQADSALSVCTASNAAQPPF